MTALDFDRVHTVQANIAMDEDKKEEQKKGDVDRTKLETDIKACRDTASAVGSSATLTTNIACITGIY